MAMNKDSGDSRTYVADKLTSFEWRMPRRSSPSAQLLSSSKTNWPGKLGRAQANILPHINILCYASTITSDDAAVIQVSNSSTFASGNVSANGHTRGTSTDHAQIPGLHFAAISANTLSNNSTIHLRATHLTDTTATRSKEKFDS
tara:strand:+ start:3072 stop:3506 length:435 start_codon:yes stop_codon:yes gene_type:complete